MVLIGILESGLGGFTTVRGYASLDDIISISKTEEFQRIVNNKHVEEIKDFYVNRTALFFPEIILSYVLRYDYTNNTLNGTPLQNILEQSEFVSNIDDIKFKPLKMAPRGQQILVITIKDDWLRENKPFSIIDGNHRIQAYDRFMDSEDSSMSYERYLSPFSLILFDENENSYKNKKLIFHNINAKAIKLTTEEELKGIVNDIQFTDDELENDFGIEYLYVRRLNNIFPDDQFENLLSNIKSSFIVNENTLIKNSIFIRLIKFILHNNIIDLNSSFHELIEAIRTVNNEFYNYENLRKFKNSALFISAVGIELNFGVKLKFFLNWLSNNQLGELTEIKAQSIYDIYIKLNEQRPKVFVAMPYFSEDEIESYNQSYNRVIDRINIVNPDVRLTLFPIMIYKGGTKDIVIEMLNQINSCSIFIADISGANSNVAYELGYARSKDIDTIIVRRNDDAVEVPFDYEHDYRNRYNSLALHTLEEVIYNNIKAILVGKGYAFE